MKKALKLGGLFAICFTSTACGGSSPSTNLNTNSSENFSSINIVETFEETIETNLIHETDYIDHSLTSTYNDTIWYKNDLSKVPLPDPHVFVEDGIYYIVGTSDRSSCDVIDCYYTTDFVEFNTCLDIYDPSQFNGWEDDSPSLYAPEIYCFDGVYYMYYSAVDSTGKRHNSVVEADNPLGPYQPIVNTSVNGLLNPLFTHNRSVLDSTIFVDDNGDMYMYYSTVQNGQHIEGVKLKSPYEADYSTQKVLIIPGNSSTTNTDGLLVWEKYRSGSYITEAPYMIKSNGKYYLTYSVNGCWNKYYNICYAVSSSPLGDYVKPYTPGKLWTNLLLGYPGDNNENSLIYNQWSGFASGTGHHCFFNIGEQIMIGYHAHMNRNYNEDGVGYVRRYFAMDPLYFDENGVPYSNGPTYSIQPLPHDISSLSNIALDAEIISENVTNETFINDNYIVDCYNLESENNEVILGEGYSYIKLKFDKEYEIHGLGIYNSAYFDKMVYELNYINFVDGNVIGSSGFDTSKYLNLDYNFIFPNSGFTFELNKKITTDEIIISFYQDVPSQINEIIVLGK